jgi:hypothetical protein
MEIKTQYLKRYFSSVLISCILIAGCKKQSVEPLEGVKTTELVGIWKMTTTSVVIKGTAGGEPVNINQKRDGTPVEYLEFMQDGGVNDPGDIFGTGTYTWTAFVTNGNDLKLRKGVDANRDCGYFTVRINGNRMTWTMNKEQAIRSSKDSDGYSSVLNGGTDEFDDLKELTLTMEFTKK